MGKGFDIFMQNPYWVRIYEDAPSEELKEYYRLMFDVNSIITPLEKDEEAEARIDELFLNKEDIEYLKENAGIPQAKAFYQLCIDKLEKSEFDGICARYLMGEIRNPWYTSPENN